MIIFFSLHIKLFLWTVWVWTEILLPSKFWAYNCQSCTRVSNTIFCLNFVVWIYLLSLDLVWEVLDIWCRNIVVAFCDQPQWIHRCFNLFPAFKLVLHPFPALMMMEYWCWSLGLYMHKFRIFKIIRVTDKSFSLS